MVNKLHPNYECPFDTALYRVIDPHLEAYHRVGVTPNILTTMNLVCGTASAYNILLHNYAFASILYATAYYFDCADGKLARKYGNVTVFGDYYDHIVDTVRSVFVFGALYITNPERFMDFSLVLIGLFIAMKMHLGLQETVYKNATSSFLSMNKWWIRKEWDHKRMIQFSRFFGCGTKNVFIFFMILLWGTVPL